MLDLPDAYGIDAVTNNINEAAHQYNCIGHPDLIEQTAKMAVMEYNQNMKGVKAVCKGFMTELEENTDVNNSLEEIVRVLKLKSTKAPRRPQRIILMGPPGADKEAHALRIAEKYQLIYVQVPQLIKDAIRREGDTQFAKDLAFKLQRQEMRKYID